MKILFICGSLDPGRDGVGDYSRRLAAELIRQGLIISILALYDKGVEVISKEFQESENTQVPVLRIPDFIQSKIRYNKTEQFINDFNPEWLSLQYVPYSFQKRGMPFGFGKQLYKIGKGRKWHIMFHELWIGISVRSPLRHKIIGFFQKFIAKNIISNTKAEFITTTNYLYQLVLQNENIKSELLHLFSNIPISEFNQDLKSTIVKSISSQNSLNLDQFIVLGVFGTIYPQANLEVVLNKMFVKSLLEQKTIIFISVGRIGMHGVSELKRLADIFVDKIQFINLGEQTPEYISTILQILSFGISCTPQQHIGKSGVFAAMKLHGLEVIMSCHEVIPEYDKLLNEYYPMLNQRLPELWSVEHIANDFRVKLRRKNTY